MNLLNLLNSTKTDIPYQVFHFPDGQPHIKLDMSVLEQLNRTIPVRILTRINTSNDLLLALLAKNSLDYHEFERVELVITYLMSARMDRIMNPGEPFSLKVVANLINSGGFKKVNIFDPHSEVSLALIDRAYPISNHYYVKDVLAHHFREAPGNDFCIVSPDAGALKKIHQLAQFLEIDRVVECMKERDVKTGALTNFTTAVSSLKGQTCIIVDDICDGGGTFVGTAKMLKEKGAKEVILVVSHGIFSKGEQLEYVDKIYSTNSFRQLDNVICFNIENYV